MGIQGRADICGGCISVYNETHASLTRFFDWMPAIRVFLSRSLIHSNADRLWSRDFITPCSAYPSVDSFTEPPLICVAESTVTLPHHAPLLDTLLKEPALPVLHATIELNHRNHVPTAANTVSSMRSVKETQPVLNVLQSFFNDGLARENHEAQR